MKPNETIYAGEAQFAGWSDSHTRGPIISFRLPSSDALDNFRAMTVAKASQAGHLVMLAVVEQGEEGQPMPPPEPTKAADPKPRRARIGPLCMEAVGLCNNARFQQWVSEQAGVEPTEEFAKEYILSQCDVDSRKDLDTNPEAGLLFTSVIRNGFLQWNRANPVEGQDDEDPFP